MLPSTSLPRHRSVASALALSLLSIACGPDSGSLSPSAHAAEQEAASPEPIAVTIFTEQVELFMEYPRLVRGEEARYLAHVTVLETGEPVRTGRLVLELVGPGGEPLTLEAPQPTRDGLFIPVGAIGVAGEYAARIVVESDQVRDTIPLDPLVVHADLAAAFAAEAAEAGGEGEPPGAVPFLLEQQWKVGLLLEPVQRRTLVQRLRVPGEIEAPQGALAVASAPLSGRLLAPAGGQLPRIGERVEAGQVLALLEPPLTTSDRAQLVSIEAGYRALDADLLARELDREAEELELAKAQHQSRARLDFARQALARLQGLREKDLGTEAELEAARLEVDVSEREVDGVRELRAAFERGRERLGELRARTEVARSEAANQNSVRYPLVAAISGEIIEADRIAGENVEGGATVFRILDSSRVWIRADVSEFELDGLDGLQDSELGALLEFAAYPDRTFDVLGAMGGRVIHVGRMVDPLTRTVHLHWEAENEDELLYVGMFADVYLETGRSLDAVAVPEGAIVQQNGRSVVYVLLDGETFQERVLELGRRDGRFLEVLAGLEVGERVVTKGANLVRLASVSPASFGEGHAH